MASFKLHNSSITATVSASAAITASTNTTATITVTATGSIPSGYYVYSTGVVATITIAGSSATKTVFGNATAYYYGKDGAKSVTYAVTVDKSTAAQSVSWSVAFKNAVDGTVKSTQYTATGTVSVPAKPSYTVSYNANGGSNAPSSQTKWYGTSLTLSSTKPTRTGHSFQGWATSASGSVAYASGAAYTANAAVTLYAVWKANTYTVSYNANGGSGAPSSQTKTYGVTLTLATDIPTRTNYNFLGWSASASATTATYEAGDSYTANNAVTLYAVWELAYTKPRINNLQVFRLNDDGELADDGTCVSVVFDWETDVASPTGTIEWTPETDGVSSEKMTFEAVTSGTMKHFMQEYTFSTESTYRFTITVADANGYSVEYVTLPGMAFAIDFRAGGTGAALGKPAERDGIFDIAFQTKFAGGIENIVLEKHNDLNNANVPNTYVSINQGASYYSNCPITSGTFVLEVMSAGAEGQLFQRLTTTFKATHETYERHYYQGSWGDWVLVRSDTGWVDLTLQSDITVGSEVGYLRGRLKNGVLYIKGDVLGISANWKYFAQIPAAILPDGLPGSTRVGAVYNMSYFCGLNIMSNGQVYVSANSAGSWDATNAVAINVAICV